MRTIPLPPPERWSHAPTRIGDVLGSVLGSIIRRAGHQRVHDGPVTSLIRPMSEEEFGHLLGPAWSAMSAEQQQRYPDRWTTDDWLEVEARARQGDADHAAA